MDEMDQLMAATGGILWFILSIIVIITFFVIAARIKKILSSTKIMENMMSLSAQKRGDIQVTNCPHCGKPTGFWVLDQHMNCTVCGYSERVRPKKQENNGKSEVKIDPKKIKSAAEKISKIDGVTETILNDAYNHFTVRVKTQILSVNDIQEKLQPIRDLGVETAVLLA